MATTPCKCLILRGFSFSYVSVKPDRPKFATSANYVYTSMSTVMHRVISNLIFDTGYSQMFTPLRLVCDRMSEYTTGVLQCSAGPITK